ncbi:hypothetical protein B0H19DRAFT_95115 [Mycena capillaripes]|nr:hypothetical protein B0H19DRAFT_95115 [Mycena capillaripes]
MSDSRSYSRLLLHKGHGHPVFCPQPSDDLPAAIRQTGARIRDVGVITSDGSFDVIFNVCAPANDPANRFGVPEGFTQIDLGESDIFLRDTHHGPGCSISNTEVRKRRLDLDLSLADNVFSPVGAGATVEISASSKEAVLILPDGGSRCNARPLDKFRSYALEHARSWYIFVNKRLHRMIDSGDLYFITGCDKSSSWNLAVTQNRSDDAEVSLRLRAAQIGSAGGIFAWQWEDVTSEVADSGPWPRPGDEGWKNNQTVFVRGFRVAIRPAPLSVLKGPSKAVSIENSKPKDLLRKSGFTPFSQGGSDCSGGLGASGSKSPGGAPEDSISVEPIEEDQKPYHPATAINDYLLKISDAPSAIAITHDDDWIFVLSEVCTNKYVEFFFFCV